MLEDIVLVTETIFDKFIVENKPLKDPKKAYDSYRALDKVISNVNIVSEHYLALHLNEDYLQNSSCEEPIDKWREVLNGDLSKLNDAIKDYLLKLSYLGTEDEIDILTGFMDSLYSSKVFYAFIHDKYNVGLIEEHSTSIISHTLSKQFNNDTLYIFELNKTDLSSFKKRQTLRMHLREQKKILIKCEEDLKNYILKNYSIEDLL